MKNVRTSFRRLIVGGALAVTLSTTAHAQTNLNFTQARATSEGAIQLFWNSTTNELYEIDYADELVDTNTGYITWVPLYTDYPSHGGTTFIADAGNYDLVPEIPHPKYTTQRFYRIALSGTNTSPTNPTVSIISPTNAALLTGDVVVSVSSYSSEILADVKLYIDGEEQWASDDGTNFLINTCEWPNGPHVLFATAKSQSAISGFAYNHPTTSGRAVSSYVNVVFTNLITRFDFSQNFFEPSEGQTQHVSAVFAANVNWTLEIQNEDSNTVRFTSGSGASMGFDWDGTGTNGAVIPDGIYSYLLTVATNGLPIPPPDYGESDTNPPPVPGGSYATSSSSSDWFPVSKRQAIAAGWDHWYIQPPPMPPVWTNGAWHDWDEIYGPRPWFEFQIPENESTFSTSSSMSMDTPTPEYSGQASQNSRAPKRKPRKGVKNNKGTFGICYKTYPNGAFSQEPRTGLLSQHTGIDGHAPTSSYYEWTDLPADKSGVPAFSAIMQKGGFKAKFIKADEQWGPQDIKKPSLGGNSIFNTCDFGLLEGHSVYGTNPEIDGVKYIYFYLFDQKYGGSYVKLSEMDFGSAATHGLKWMTLDTCNSLYPANITSMANNGKMPDNDNLHLLIGHATVSYSVHKTHQFYASNLVAHVKIIDSLVKAETDAYQIVHQAGWADMTNAVAVRAIGYQSCYDDSLYIFNDPDPNTTLLMQSFTTFTP